MKKIIFAMPQLFGGGAERVVASLVNQISRMDGCQVHLITYIRDPEKDYPVETRVIRHSMQADEETTVRRILGKIQFLRRNLRDIQPDCVVSLAGPAMITLLVLSMYGLGIPLILSERNDPQSYPKPWYLRVLRVWAYRCSDAMVFQTHEAMSFFPACIQRKGTVISNPLTERLPESYAGPREPRIVTSCRLTPQKNLDLMIDAFCDIAPEFPGYTLDIYGEGPEKDRLEAKLRSMQLSDRVILHGYSSRIYEDIGKASLFVSSSDYEGISNSMLEAIALGIPTVCTDCPAGGARETIVHGSNGLLVPVKDRKKLAEAMASILSDKTLAEQLGREGTTLRDKNSIASIAQQWMGVIRGTICASQD